MSLSAHEGYLKDFSNLIFFYFIPLWKGRDSLSKNKIPTPTNCPILDKTKGQKKLGGSTKRWKRERSPLASYKAHWEIKRNPARPIYVTTKNCSTVSGAHNFPNSSHTQQEAQKDWAWASEPNLKKIPPICVTVYERVRWFVLTMVIPLCDTAHTTNP